MIRSNYAGGDGTYHLKVLVPGVAAGAIIGKGGDTIAQLQKDTGARVKMSKSHDFYPGTSALCLLRLRTHPCRVCQRGFSVLLVCDRNYRESVLDHGQCGSYHGSHGFYHGEDTRKA